MCSKILFIHCFRFNTGHGWEGGPLCLIVSKSWKRTSSFHKLLFDNRFHLYIISLLLVSIGLASMKQLMWVEYAKVQNTQQLESSTTSVGSNCRNCIKIEITLGYKGTGSQHPPSRQHESAAAPSEVISLQNQSSHHWRSIYTQGQVKQWLYWWCGADTTCLYRTSIIIFLRYKKASWSPNKLVDVLADDGTDSLVFVADRYVLQKLLLSLDIPFLQEKNTKNNCLQEKGTSITSNSASYWSHYKIGQSVLTRFM